MKRSVTFLLSLIATLAAAQDNRPADITFSEHGLDLTFTWYEKEANTHRFVGPVTLAGTLFLVSDMETPDRAERFGGNEKSARISHGPSHEASKRATVVLASFSTAVECNSRAYSGEVASVGALRGFAHLPGDGPHGC